MHVTKPFEYGQLVLGSNADGFVELASRLEDVGDLSLGDGASTHIAESLEYGQLLLDSDAESFVEISAGLEDIGNPSLGNGNEPAVVESGESSSRVPIGCFRLLHVSQGILQIAQLQREIDVGRSPLGAVREMTLELLNSRDALGCRRGLSGIR